MKSKREIVFGGWFQCRLATGPDPADEKRGVSGFTFATVEEDDLDRVIRLQKDDKTDKNKRKFSPTLGVRVTNHPKGDLAHFRNARVSFDEKTKFIEFNGVYNNANRAFIHPLALCFDLENGGKIFFKRFLQAEKALLTKKSEEVKKHFAEKSRSRGEFSPQVLDMVQAYWAEEKVDLEYWKKSKKISNDSCYAFFERRKEKLEREISMIDKTQKKQIISLRQRHEAIDKNLSPDINVPWSNPIDRLQRIVKWKREVVNSSDEYFAKHKCTLDLNFGHFDIDTLCGVISGSITVQNYQ